MQIIFRIFGPGIPVFDFAVGGIVDGGFKPFEDVRGCLDSLVPALSEFVHLDDLLGTRAYVKLRDLGVATALITAHPRFAGMQFYPNFIVFDLEDHAEFNLDNHVEAKKEDA